MKMLILWAGFVALMLALGTDTADSARRARRMVPIDEGGFVGLHDKIRIGNKVCFSDHAHEGSSGSQPSQKVAMTEALRSWAGFVAWEYGSHWASWKLAVAQNASCGRSGGSWSCQVSARPCRRGR